MAVVFRSDPAVALGVIREAASWLAENELNPSQWWQLDFLDDEHMAPYCSRNDLVVGLDDGTPAVAAALQLANGGPAFAPLDGDSRPQCVYVSWLAVARRFAGQGYAHSMLRHAETVAHENGLERVRLDTNADVEPLNRLYRSAGFELVAVMHEVTGRRALYEKFI